LPGICIAGDDKAQKRLLRRMAKALGRLSTNEDAGQAANFVIASAGEPIQPLDCFVAPLLAMTGVPEKKMAGSRPA
jgi:hypothetical protein